MSSPHLIELTTLEHVDEDVLAVVLAEGGTLTFCGKRVVFIESTSIMFQGWPGTRYFFLGVYDLAEKKLYLYDDEWHQTSDGSVFTRGGPRSIHRETRAPRPANELDLIDLVIAANKQG